MTHIIELTTRELQILESILANADIKKILSTPFRVQALETVQTLVTIEDVKTIEAVQAKVRTCLRAYENAKKGGKPWKPPPTF